MTVDGLRAQESFLESLSDDVALDDDRFVARNFRLDENMPEGRTKSYCEAVFPAADFRGWQRKHAVFVKDRLVRIGTATGPPAVLDRSDPERCPETFGEEMIPISAVPIALDLSLVRVVGVHSIAQSLGLDETRVLDGLHDPVLRDGIIESWVAKLAMEPVFATLWQDVRDLVPQGEDPPAEWADDLRDRLGLSFYDPDRWGPINVMVLRYPVSSLPFAEDSTGRPLAVPTELDGRFFPPFCPVPLGMGVGRVVSLGEEVMALGPELLHPTIRWRGAHVAALGVIKRPVPALAPARGRHLKLVREVYGRADYGLITDGDLESAP
ncbi:MAG: hypothetical protein ACTHK6_04670 [Solirubrobacterales bacterium]